MELLQKLFVIGKAEKHNRKMGICLLFVKKLNLDPRMFLKKKTNPFAEMLKRKRCELGLTQSDLAIKLGYRRDTIAKWEGGKRISKHAKEDICTFFGIEI